MCTEVEKLAELYECLPDIPHFSSLLKSKGTIFNYNVENEGEFTSVSLLDEPLISIAKSHITEGAIVDFHHHANSYEIIIVLRGAMSIDFNTYKRIVEANDYIVIDKYIPHGAKVIKDCEFVAITVPKDEGFPTK